MKKLSVRYSDSIPPEKLFLVWKEFLKGKKGREDVTLFQMRLTDNLIALSRDLREKTYVHGPYHPFSISDPKQREIHKATVRDRIVHHLSYQMLYAYFDVRFVHDSYSCRLDKGTYRAIYRFTAFARSVSKNHTRTCWVLQGDIRKFFASINHAILKEILRTYIDSDDTLWLLSTVIDSFHTEGKPGVGLPLGNLTSQLLVNIYLNEFDRHMKEILHARHYVRYSDDFVLLSHDKNALLKTLPYMEVFLRDRLKLALHPNKVSIHTLASGIDFLGWVHFPDHRVLRTATKRRMFQNLTGELKKERISSYLGMLTHGNARKLVAKIPELAQK